MPKTKRRKQKLCNHKCVENAVRVTGEDPRMVRQCVNALWNYVRDTIDSQSLEEIYVYKFGRFKPRMKLIAKRTAAKAERETKKLTREAHARQIKRMKKNREQGREQEQGGDQ